MLNRLFPTGRDRNAMRSLYEAVVAEARTPAYYRAGRVPDTVDGRFDLLSSVLTLALLRLEAEGDVARRESVELTERFIDDLDGELRQMGVGDLMVGKNIGKLMGTLGGKLGAFRAALTGSPPVREVIARNVYRDADVEAEALATVETRLCAFEQRLGRTSLADLVAGDIAA